MTDCRRTPWLIGRVVAGRATQDDREHAATCPRCGPVLVRAAGFDAELRRSARSLVTEELPRGILDLPVFGRDGRDRFSRRAAPGVAATLAAVAILVVGTVIALAPGTGPAETPTPTATANPTEAPFAQRFRSTKLIASKLATLGYGCNDGGPLQSVGPGADAVASESRVCLAPDSAGPFLLAAIVGEARNGSVVELTIKGEVIGDTIENRGLLAMNVAKVLAVSLVDETVGSAGGLWVKTHLPELEVGDAIDATLDGVSFHAERAPNGSYRLVIRGAAAP